MIWWTLAACGPGPDPVEGLFEHRCSGANLVLTAELRHTREDLGEGVPSWVGGVGDLRRYDLDGEATDEQGRRFVGRGYLNACFGGCAVDCAVATQTGCNPDAEGDYPDGYSREDTWWTPVDEATVATGPEVSVVGIVYEGFGTTGDCWLDDSALASPYTMERIGD